MAHFAEVNIPGFVAYCSGSAVTLEGIKARAKENFKAVFEEHRDRVYSIAFYMTDNELTAEEISTRVFLKSFHGREKLAGEVIDRELVGELREMAPIGTLTVDEKPSSAAPMGNAKRHLMERAVVQIPATERLAFLLHDVEGYDHSRVGRMLGISETESRKAVLQARLMMRRLMAEAS